MTGPALPSGYDAARTEVQRVAVHVLARARHQAVGRFGLVPTPGGVGTPAFGPDAGVVRLTGSALLGERGGDVVATPLAGATLRSLAEAAGADVDADLSVGHDTPPTGDVDQLLELDPAAIRAIGWWTPPRCRLCRWRPACRWPNPTARRRCIQAPRLRMSSRCA